MLKFIRRLFILLVLFLVVFVIYRYINPDGASKLVEKIKAIPWYFWLLKDDNIKIEWETIISSGDVIPAQNSGENTDDDLSWLEDLNKEIETILGEDKTWVVVDQSLLENENIENVQPTNTWVVLSTWVNVVSTWSNNVVATGSTTTTTTTTTTKKTDQLSDSDYKQIRDVFGNFVE